MTIARDIAAWISASIDKRGPVELATQAEVDAGTDTERAITPATLEGADALPGALIETKVFTLGGTWTKPAGAKFIYVECVGGGGGGAGLTSAAGEWRLPGGGGGGGYGAGLFLASDWGATVAVVAGSGGSGGASGNNAGADGNDSTFNGTSSPYVKAFGGGGGATAAADNTGGGGSGGIAFVIGEILDTEYLSYGGHSAGGFVGPVMFVANAGAPAGGPICGMPIQRTPAAQPFRLGGLSPTPTYNPGHGGSAAAVKNSAGSASGGNGASGRVIVTSYA